ncbi:MAG: hypothetical protein P1U41_11130 [Vicingaceae bacterium]|nr:hypothetical protein [Vicingaceae bacterium]
MKALFIILFLLVGVLSSDAYAGNNNNDPQTQDEKKTAKPKYDFNIFKFFSIPLQQSSDSLKTLPQTKNKSIFLTKKDYFYNTKKRS